MLSLRAALLFPIASLLLSATALAAPPAAPTATPIATASIAPQAMPVSPAAPASAGPVATPSTLPAGAASSQPAPLVSPLSEAQLKDPAAALAAARKTASGDILTGFGAVYISGLAQVQNQLLPFTFAADFRTGYNRMIVLLPHNSGTYEYGVDRTGGWSAGGGFVHPLSALAQNIKTALYANRFGFLNYPADNATLKEIGVDPKLGDRITVTPAGGAQFLMILKPSTSLVSAVQYGNGQVNVYADYRKVAGVLYPYRMMQGTDVNKMSVFQATKVEFSKSEPDLAAVSRPSLPVAAATPAPKAATAPASKPTAPAKK